MVMLIKWRYWQILSKLTKFGDNFWQVKILSMPKIGTFTNLSSQSAKKCQKPPMLTKIVSPRQHTNAHVIHCYEFIERWWWDFVHVFIIVLKISNNLLIFWAIFAKSAPIIPNLPKSAIKLAQSMQQYQCKLARLAVQSSDCFVNRCK